MKRLLNFSSRLESRLSSKLPLPAKTLVHLENANTLPRHILVNALATRLCLTSLTASPFLLISAMSKPLALMLFLLFLPLLAPLLRSLVHVMVVKTLGLLEFVQALLQCLAYLLPPYYPLLFLLQKKTPFLPHCFNKLMNKS